MTQETTSITAENLAEVIASSQREIAHHQKQIKDCRDLLDEELQKLAQIHRQKEFEKAQERGRIWKKDSPQEHAAFLAGIEERNLQTVLDGAKQGWWDVDEQGNMLAPPIVIDSTQLPDGALMAHVMAEAAIFPSVSQARKNGWDKPLTKGLFTVTKKKIRIKVL